MENLLRDTLNSISEGVIIVDYDTKIHYWNDYMEFLTGVRYSDAVGKSVYTVLPKLNKSYFIESIQSIQQKGSKLFFSAAIHQGLVSDEYNLNLKISKIDKGNDSYILLEFINVTNQYLTIAQLKETINKLYLLNEELKTKEETIQSLAYYDNLTGIANRNLFYQIGEKLYQEAHSKDKIVSIVFIDIDNFKTINDTYGHKTGDQVLVEVSKYLNESTCSCCNLVARYGGDEFLLFFCADDFEQIIASASSILHNNQILIKGYPIQISLSIGISAEKPSDGSTLDELISRADKAMYSVKKNGGNNWHLWSDNSLQT